MVRKLSPEKKALFLNAALKLFALNGVQNTSTAAIASEAGTAAGTLFLYFPTKQDLIDALVLKIGTSQSEHIKALLTSSLSVRETFQIIWEGTIQWFQENMEAYIYLQQVRDTGMVSEQAVRESESFFGYFYHVIQKGLDEGQIKTYPLELIGTVLYQDMVAVMNLIKAQNDSVKQNSYIQDGFDLFWNGIRST